jgi:hypothetical protein
MLMSLNIPLSNFIRDALNRFNNIAGVTLLKDNS